jgi:L-asparagine oxygenase
MEDGLAMHLERVFVSEAECSNIRKIAKIALNKKKTANISDVIDDVAVLSGEMPRRIRRIFYKLIPSEVISAIHVVGAPFEDKALSLSPIPSYRDSTQEIDFNDIVHLLFLFLLGQPFTFSSIQSGRVISDVSPDPAHSADARSSGFSSVFDFHTDDAFSDLAGDILALRCVRNSEKVPTLIAFIDDLSVDQEWASILFEKKFSIRPNVAHSSGNFDVSLRSVLFGNRKSPYLRINMNLPACDGSDSLASAAYMKLEDAIRRNAHAVCLGAGDCLFIDNFRAIHGRGQYVPEPQGYGRWYRRVYATSAFRNSREFRSSALDRLVRM